MTPRERFLAKTQPGPGDCLDWIGAFSGNGYGYFWLDGKSIGAHCAALILIGGIELGPGDTVDHVVCRRTVCVNDDHMEVVTRSENTKRGNYARVDPFASRREGEDVWTR